MESWPWGQAIRAQEGLQTQQQLKKQREAKHDEEEEETGQKGPNNFAS